VIIRPVHKQLSRQANQILVPLSKKEITMKRIILYSIGALISIFFTACGPSQVELDATATQAAADQFATQTAAAPTATPTSTPTQTPTATATHTQPPSPQCRLISISPVAGAAFPSYDYRAEGFDPNELVLITLSDTAKMHRCSGFENANDQGQVESNITWNLFETGVPVPTKMTLELNGTGCTAIHEVTWP
jgi:hypothetical protein